MTSEEEDKNFRMANQSPDNLKRAVHRRFKPFNLIDLEYLFLQILEYFFTIHHQNIIYI